MIVSADKYHRGMATLLFCTILLGAATTLVFTLARTGLAEQRITTNIHRHENMRQAGDAGLAFAMAWLRGNTPDWQPTAAGPLMTVIPVPDDNLGQDAGLVIHIAASRQGATTTFILLDVQAWYPDSNFLLDTNRYRVRQYINVSVINQLPYDARITPLPGTWHDFGNT